MIDPALLERVEVTEWDAREMPDLEGCVCVRPIWRGVDRPDVGGITVRRNQKKLIERTKRCMETGAFWSKAEVCRDVNDQTYVSATPLCRGKYLNADLKRLGY